MIKQATQETVLTENEAKLITMIATHPEPETALLIAFKTIAEYLLSKREVKNNDQ